MKNDFRYKRNRPHRLKMILTIVFGLLCVINVPVHPSANDDRAENDSIILSPGVNASHRNSVFSIFGKNEALINFPETEGAFTVFRHNNQIHSQLSCVICHRRATNSPRVTFPGKEGHLPCIGCHTQQFAGNTSPICTICHSNVETGSLKRFPPLRSFGVQFAHSKHLNVNCATCHKPQGRGIAKSIPQGPGTHSTCFQCHSSQTKERMSSCSVCHKPGRGPGARTSEWAKSFTVNFSHAKHNLSCNNCHDVLAGSRRGRQVTKPLASMHFAPANRQTCASCHNNKKVFGGDDFSDCKRCHTGKGFKF